MSDTRKVYFITGANKPNGIGFRLVEKLVARPDTLVFATARDPTRATELQALADKQDNLVLLQLEATSEEDARAAAKAVEQKAGKIDVLIANAGYFESGNVLDQSIEGLRKSWEINALGPIILFKALATLLFKSSAPVFAPTSTAAGSFGLDMGMPLAAYGSSKAALNFLTLNMHHAHEKENLTAFVTHPGMVDTAMADEALPALGLTKEQAKPISVEESTEGLLAVYDAATRASHGGKFFSYDGSALPY
ncbi:hypothetical protein BMF94_1378 [Rhodotorula taiwanensis]|uniref:NAD(P)-binding protein n=1 Tax=Rhodotorula taiwanensis TaxID=741276 RepID=A0A2S5BFC3_9BASI|nr:hypothetical protein BMF94_1378 [Rhodotorula taiwanensis]